MENLDFDFLALFGFDGGCGGGGCEVSPRESPSNCSLTERIVGAILTVSASRGVAETPSTSRDTAETVVSFWWSFLRHLTCFSSAGPTPKSGLSISRTISTSLFASDSLNFFNELCIRSGDSTTQSVPSSSKPVGVGEYTCLKKVAWINVRTRRSLWF